MHPTHRPVRIRFGDPPPPAPRGTAPTERDVEQVRAFNRFYTTRAGLLNPDHLGSNFSLAQVRVLFEIAYGRELTATDLNRKLGLSRGYVSKILRGFSRTRLLTHARTVPDGRFKALRLTPQGRETFGALERAATESMRTMLGSVDPAGRDSVIDAMNTIRGALIPRLKYRPQIRLRPPQPGDLGWVVQRHGALYAAEYGYDFRFEGLVARIVADFAEGRYGSRERCWIAEVDRARAGCVFVVRASAKVAQLRLLLTEPWARGRGLGRRLVQACTQFARAQHYKELVLWTQSELISARRLYEAEGYTRTATKRHQMFGKPAVAETWTLKL